MPLIVVEDNDLLRLCFRETLEEAGHAVTTFASAEEALAASVDEPPGLLVTDINLAGMDGHHLAAAARRRWPDLAVLFISGHPKNWNPVLGPRDRFLRKPFLLSDLLRTVAELNPAPGRRFQRLAS